VVTPDNSPNLQNLSDNVNLFKIKGQKDVSPEKPMNKGIEKKGEGGGRKTFHL